MLETKVIRTKAEAEMFVASRLREAAKWIDLAMDVVEHESDDETSIEIKKFLQSNDIDYHLIQKLIIMAKNLECK